MNREDFEARLADARVINDIIGELADAGLKSGYRVEPAQLRYLSDELEAQLESIEGEADGWSGRTEPKPPSMPPLTEREVAGNAEITEKLQGLADKLHQRNLDRAVELAREAAEGRGPLVAHFGELGRRFAPEGDPQGAGEES